MPQINFEEDATTEFIGTGKVYRTLSKSRPGMYNITAFLDSGVMFCSCEGFKFRGACKHTERILGG